ncbi:hypothetical protein FSARC_100 [Fusarium sarcochroum]|uniref:Major facilitator superfamily (MFS) profile domain-containing protein n=1 Tax=Fusarium sarcochroum TaxID=1208366 RepID=A0A8H4XGU0_9HYPO|nr:hypothetical protein FSARC_100 [Fusarium sarcochroum]
MHLLKCLLLSLLVGKGFSQTEATDGPLETEELMASAADPVETYAEEAPAPESTEAVLDESPTQEEEATPPTITVDESVLTEDDPESTVGLLEATEASETTEATQTADEEETEVPDETEASEVVDAPTDTEATTTETSDEETLEPTDTDDEPVSVTEDPVSITEDATQIPEAQANEATNNGGESTAPVEPTVLDNQVTKASEVSTDAENAAPTTEVESSIGTTVATNDGGATEETTPADNDEAEETDTAESDQDTQASTTAEGDDNKEASATAENDEAEATDTAESDEDTQASATADNDETEETTSTEGDDEDDDEAKATVTADDGNKATGKATATADKTAGGFTTVTTLLPNSTYKAIALELKDVTLGKNEQFTSVKGDTAILLQPPPNGEATCSIPPSSSSEDIPTGEFIRLVLSIKVTGRDESLKVLKGEKTGSRLQMMVDGSSVYDKELIATGDSLQNVASDRFKASNNQKIEMIHKSGNQPVDVVITDANIRVSNSRRESGNDDDGDDGSGKDSGGSGGSGGSGSGDGDGNGDGDKDDGGSGGGGSNEGNSSDGGDDEGEEEDQGGSGSGSETGTDEASPSSSGNSQSETNAAGRTHTFSTSWSQTSSMGSSHASFLTFRGQSLRYAQIGLIAAPAFISFGYNQAGLGALMGSLSCLFLGDQLGRRKTIFLAAVLTLIGQILQVSSYSLAQFVVDRVILGIGIGEISVVVPIWLSECSPASHRGRDVIAAGIFMCLGYALCNWIDYAFFNLPTSTLQWRLPLAVSMPLACLILGVVMSMPESPRWLVSVNQTEKATATLLALKDRSEIDETISIEIAQIESSLKNARQESTSLMHMFSKNEEKLGYRFFLCIFLQFVQQMCGGTLISVYASTIFQDNLSLGTSLSKTLAAYALTWKFLSCFIGYVAIDKWGRRAVFMISGAGMSMCMTALAICTSFPSSSHSASIA